jgi:serine/threonine-protein kinase
LSYPQNQWPYRQALYERIKRVRLLHHPNIARVYDLLELAGREFISMEYVPGISLATYLNDEGALAPRIGLEIFRQLCQGLAAAHGRGIVHHDLRPEQIILGPDWRVVIMDLGTQLPQLPEGASPQGLAANSAAAHGASEPEPNIIEDGQIDITALGLIGYQLFSSSAEHLAEEGVEFEMSLSSGDQRPAAVSREQLQVGT